REALEQARFEARRLRTRQLDSTRGRAQHDHRLDPGDVVEEPAARGKHAERLALELRGQSSTLALEHGVQLSREPVEGRTQRRAPALLRGALRRGATAALGAPALHPVGTAPRAGCDEPHFLLGLVPGQERRETLDSNVVAPCQGLEHPGEDDVALLVMVPVRLAVRRDRHQPVGRGGQALDPRDGVAYQGSERDVVRDRAIIDERADPAATARTIPAGEPAFWGTLHLVGGEDREADPCGVPQKAGSPAGIVRAVAAGSPCSSMMARSRTTSRSDPWYATPSRGSSA